MVRFLIACGAQVSDAADAAQSAMVSAYRRWSRVGAMAAPAAYVRTSAFHEWLRLLKRRVSDREHAISAEWFDLEQIEDLYWRHDVAAVMRALSSLPPRQRQVMACTYDGMTPQEIADLLGMTADTVRSTLRHARAALRETVGGLDEEGLDG